MKRYFFMEQDKSIRDTICLERFDITGPKHLFKKDEASKLNDTSVLYLAEKSGEVAPDFLQSPISLVSEMGKKVLEMYEDSLIFKKVVMIDKAKSSQIMYYHVLFEEIEGLDPLVERYLDGTEKKICLSKEKIGNYRVFMLKDSRKKVPIISLEVAESLLRRNLIGVHLKEVEVV